MHREGYPTALSSQVLSCCMLITCGTTRTSSSTFPLARKMRSYFLRTSSTPSPCFPKHCSAQPPVFLHVPHLVYRNRELPPCIRPPTDNTIVFTALKYCAPHARRRLPPLPTALIAHTLTLSTIGHHPRYRCPLGYISQHSSHVHVTHG